MLQKTRGIVLHQFKFDDKKRIVTIYTEKFGRSTYIIANSKKNKITLFRPFYILDLEVLHKPKASLHKVSEVKLHVNFKTITFDFRKSSIALFLSEMLYKILKEESSNKELFNFIVSSIKYFDEKETISNHFHIVFLIHLTKFFGFYPNGEFSIDTSFFDMIDGTFCAFKPEHKYYIKDNQADIFSKCLSLDYHTSLKILKTKKLELLKIIIDYYRIHYDSIGEIKSLDVLIETFSEA